MLEDFISLGLIICVVLKYSYYLGMKLKHTMKLHLHNFEAYKNNMQEVIMQLYCPENLPIPAAIM